MAMKELLRVTLDAAKIREACEAFVATRMRINHDEEEAKATIVNDPGGMTPLCVDVIVRKRRIRKPNGAPK